MTAADPVGVLRAEFSGEVLLRLDELSDVVDQGCPEDVLPRAHKLKGSAAALALPGLVAAMEQLERVCREQPVRLDDAHAAIAAGRAVVDEAVYPRETVLGLGHALRTPLNVVLGFAHLLRDTDLSPGQRAQVEAIVQAAEEMTSLVDAAAGVSSPLPGPRPSPLPPAGSAPVTVLYVEDDLAGARLAEHSLRRLPAMRLLVAGTGAEGVALAERELPHLVLLDAGLPDIAGEEVLRRLRRGPADGIPVVVVTGESRPERLQELREAGARDCLVKPVDPARLRALVESVRPS